MEDKILVNLSTDHTFECNVDIIGREGEGNTTRLEISVPEGLTGCSVYLDFEKPNGEKFRTPKLTIENGVAIYDVVPYLLTDSGEIKVQAVLVTNSGQTWKSYTKRYLIPDSIDALEEIPEKEDFIADALSNATNALKGKKSGGAVSMTDISPLKHTLDVKVRRKNLIPYPYVHSSGFQNSGITFTVNTDGSVTAVGIPTNHSSFIFSEANVFEAGKKYVLAKGVIIAYQIDGVKKYVGGYTSQVTITWGDGWTAVQVYMQIEPTSEAVNETIYPFIVEATDTPEYTPYVADVSSVKVKKLGKNLIPFPYANSSQKMAGITFTVNDDGSVTLNGTWDGSGVPVGARIMDFYLIKRSSPLKAGRYYLSSGLPSGGTYTYRLFGHIIRADGSQVYYSTGETGQYFDIEDGDTIALSIRIGDEIGTVNNLTVYPQIELGSVGTEYEPYITPIEYPVNADGSVDGVKSIYPSTTLMTDTSGAVIDVKYNRDINKAFEELCNAIISLGGNV